MSVLADRRVRWIGASLLAAALLLLLALAAFPVGWFKPQVESRLSRTFGRPVTIATLDRREALSLSPTIVVQGLRIPQPAWAGSGAMAQIDHASLKVPVLSALAGNFTPRDITIDRGRIVIVRDANGRENLPAGGGSGGSGGLDLGALTIRDVAVGYRDAKQDRRFDVRIASDGHGLRIGGTGAVAGNPVRIAVAGAPVAGEGRWPFVARLRGPALALSARGTADRPLALGHMDVTLETRADDLKLIDRVIEAGLIGTQAVRLRARVRHDNPDWTIRELTGTIGRSDVAGALTVVKRDGRVRLDGAIRSNRLDFDDLASDAGMAAAKALEAREGLKLVPNTRVNIAKMAETDGRIAFDIRRIFSARRPSSLASAKGVLTIDRLLMTADPLRIGLTRGTIDGRVTVNQRAGRRRPLVTLDLTMRGASIATLMGDGDGAVDAPLSGRVRLAGVGDTVRAAVGRANGRIGMAARDGVLPARMAAALGFDAGRALTTDEGARARLRCAIVGLDVRGGRGRAWPLVLDTNVSGMTGTGTVGFPAESLALTLTGAPKRDSILRLPGSVRLAGTLRAPDLVVPKETKSAGNVLKALGRAITGKQGPLATDADCGALAARVLR